MDYIVSFKFNDMDITKAEMRKELEFFQQFLADKYDADLYKMAITPSEE